MIAYLKLKLAMPATIPHMICPIMCSGDTPLTSSGFPTRNASGKIKPSKENPNATPP